MSDRIAKSLPIAVTTHDLAVMAGALANGGVYAYASDNTFPNSTFNASNYWVDVVYLPS